MAGPAVTPLRLMVLEDDNLTRRILVAYLRDQGFLVSDFADGTSAIAALNNAEFDLALLDLDLGAGPSGIDVLRALRRDRPGLGAVILSSFHTAQLMDSDATELPEDVGHLVKSELESEVKILEALLAAATKSTPARSPQRPTGQLMVTRPQAELLRMISAGMSNAAIAKERNTSTRATEIMIRRLYAALGLDPDPNINNRVQASIMFRRSEIYVK